MLGLATIDLRSKIKIPMLTHYNDKNGDEKWK